MAKNKKLKKWGLAGLFVVGVVEGWNLFIRPKVMPKLTGILPFLK